MEPIVVEGNLLDQDVEAVVTPWNRNIIPWWRLLPQGVSGAIKWRAGFALFRELVQAGPIPLGGSDDRPVDICDDNTPPCQPPGEEAPCPG